MMDSINVLPKEPLIPCGPVTKELLKREFSNFREVCFWIKEQPYGYNTYADPVFALLKEGFGTCKSKHGLAAACAEELGLPVRKCLGIYLLNRTIVPEIEKILQSSTIGEIPASHCFLTFGPYRVDLTEGNCNGKSTPIDSYLYIQEINPATTDEEEKEIYGRFMESYENGLCNAENNHLLLQCVNLLKANVSCGIQG